MLLYSCLLNKFLIAMILLILSLDFILRSNGFLISISHMIHSLVLKIHPTIEAGSVYEKLKMDTRIEV